MTDISQNVLPLTLGSITDKVSGIMNSYHQDFLQIRHGGALYKAWIGYWIAIDKLEPDSEINYAKVIQNLQKELGFEVSEFECLSNWILET
ncbi:MAG: hypothetical protein ACM31J_03370 [Nitrososphaerales archaeon]